MEVVSTEVSPNRLYLKIVNKRLEMEVVPGDYVQAGVVISILRLALALYRSSRWFIVWSVPTVWW